MTNKGYRLQQPLILLNKDKILENLFPPFRQELRDIEIFDSLSSTNDYLSAKVQKHAIQNSHGNGNVNAEINACVNTRGNAHGNWVCLAESQTQGRGRMGRTWVSPFGRNLYLSVLWRLEMDISELSSLSLVTATTLAKTLQHYQIPSGLGLKWPNDVMWNNKKLAGILIELSGEAQSACQAVIGIGVNIAMSSSMAAMTPRSSQSSLLLSSIKNITQPWTDLEQMTQSYIDRNEFTSILLNHLIEALFVFQTKGFEPFRDTWESLDLTRGKSLSLQTSSGLHSGVGHGINEQGHLLVEIDNRVQAFTSGEVSVRMKTQAHTSQNTCDTVPVALN